MTYVFTTSLETRNTALYFLIAYLFTKQYGKEHTTIITSFSDILDLALLKTQQPRCLDVEGLLLLLGWPRCLLNNTISCCCCAVILMGWRPRAGLLRALAGRGFEPDLQTFRLSVCPRGQTEGLIYCKTANFYNTAGKQHRRAHHKAA